MQGSAQGGWRDLAVAASLAQRRIDASAKRIFAAHLYAITLASMLSCYHLAGRRQVQPCVDAGARQGTSFANASGDNGGDMRRKCAQQPGVRVFI